MEESKKIIGNEPLTQNQLKRTYSMDNVKLEISIDLEYKNLNVGEVLTFVAESSRNFYLETGRKINSKPL